MRSAELCVDNMQTKRPEYRINFGYVFLETIYKEMRVKFYHSPAPFVCISAATKESDDSCVCILCGCKSVFIDPKIPIIMLMLYKAATNS